LYRVELSGGTIIASLLLPADLLICIIYNKTATQYE
jgi:hypothetical protein